MRAAKKAGFSCFAFCDDGQDLLRFSNLSNRRVKPVKRRLDQSQAKTKDKSKPNQREGKSGAVTFELERFCRNALTGTLLRD